LKYSDVPVTSANRTARKFFELRTRWITLRSMCAFALLWHSTVLQY